ncbi:MAG: phytoene/squalene synthase family protein [Fibromonadaceae bacterium]|nr:phytoene/squalene synthase family protein [Fibromonadaceae bacterium]
MNEHWEYTEKMLDKVSRTFALNIRILGKKLRKPVLLAYLYMRIADTIEDDADLSAEEKATLLSKFSKALNLGGEAIDEFKNALPENWKNSEKDDVALSCNAHIVIPLLSEQPEFVRNAIKKAVAKMCEGMTYFAKLQETKKGGWFYIESESDLDKYCYYVAGLVGNMITELFCASGRFFSEKKQEKLKELAVSFGLALQLVNIIKDIQDDSMRKVCFVPMEFCRRHGVSSAQELFSPQTPQENKNAIIGELLAKATQHLRDAKEYIKTLPRVNHRRRLFCLLPSLMAADNLHIIGNGSIIFEQGRRAKISRKSVASIVRSSILLGWSNKWVEYKFTKLAQCRI